MKTAIIFLALSLMIFIGFPFHQMTAGANQLVFVSEFEGGKLYRAGKINVPVLQGNFRQMGRQYGALMKTELNEFYEFGISKNIYKKNDYLEMKEQISLALNKEPRYMQELINGMAETSELGLEKQFITSNLIMIAVSGGCSGIFAWSEYSDKGELVCGRNWDLGLPKEEMGKYVTVTVFNPTGYGNSVADVNYLSQFMVWQNGFSNEGIFMDLQNGMMADSAVSADRLNTNDLLFSMLLDYSSIEMISKAFNTFKPEEGLIINAADSQRAYSFELASNETKRRSAEKNGLLAATNDFADPSWSSFAAIPEGEKSAYTKERRANLLALGEKYKGNINADKMMQILDIKIQDGGATSPEGTNYQIVAVPAKFELWLKVNGFQDWTEIDLKPLFSDTANQ